MVCLILPLSLLFIPLSTVAQTVIQPSVSNGRVVVLHSSDNRGKIDFSVNLSGDYEQDHYVGTKRLELVSGEAVQSYIIERDAGLIVGTANRNVAQVTINNIVKTEDGIEAAISFINSDGRHRALDVSEISAHNLDGNNRCFNVERIGTDKTTVATHILIDRSGSMQGHMGTVKNALRRFVSIMPPHGRCQITSFNQTSQDHTSGYESCENAVSGIAGISAEGGTDFFTPLIGAYRELDAVTAIQKTAIIVTDGVGSGPYSKRDALDAKTASTFVFWAGDYSEQALEGLADATVSGVSFIPRSIDAFFATLGEAITEQQVLLIPKEC